MEQVLNGWQASERETGCLNGSFSSPVLENCGLRLFLWSMSRLGSLCRFKTLQEELLALEQHHVYASPLLSQMKNNFCWWNGHVARSPTQTYRLPNLLLYLSFKNSFWQTFTRLHLLWKIHTAHYFQENLKAFEDLPFSVLIAPAFTEVHWTQKQNRAAI